MMLDFDIDKLDPGIAKTVINLWQCGFITYSSCEGGNGHAWNKPIIRVSPHKGESLSRLRVKLAQHLIARDYLMFTLSESFFYQGYGVTDSRHSSNYPDRQFRYVDIIFHPLGIPDDYLPDPDYYKQKLYNKEI